MVVLIMNSAPSMMFFMGHGMKQQKSLVFLILNMKVTMLFKKLFPLSIHQLSSTFSLHASFWKDILLYHCGWNSQSFSLTIILSDSLLTPLAMIKPFEILHTYYKMAVDNSLTIMVFLILRTLQQRLSPNSRFFLHILTNYKSLHSPHIQCLQCNNRNCLMNATAILTAIKINITILYIVLSS